MISGYKQHLPPSNADHEDIPSKYTNFFRHHQLFLLLYTAIVYNIVVIDSEKDVETSIKERKIGGELVVQNRSKLGCRSVCLCVC